MMNHAQIGGRHGMLYDLSRHLLVIGAILLAAGASPAQSNNWSLTRASLVGGGGICTNGPIILLAVVGQPAGGPLTGGSYSLVAGALAQLAVVQTPGAPLLTIARSGTNIMLSWSGPATGYSLQESRDLMSGAWADINIAPVDNGDTRSVSLPNTSGIRFFRLKK